MKKPVNASDRIITALDVNSLKDAEHLVRILYPVVKTFKVGSELFTSCGPTAVKMIYGIGARVFLDLKYHDIPNTVARAGTAACRPGVCMFNVHVSGGTVMMRRCVEAVNARTRESGVERPLILGVTVLTSMDEAALRDSGVARTVDEQVTFLVEKAKEAGLDGVVASGRELEIVRRTAGEDFMIVVPGIRPAWAGANDQKRIVTPREAVKKGADYLVIGRPITGADDPKRATEKIIKEIESGE